MFRVEIIGENRLDVDFSGKLDSDDMKAGLDELFEKSKDIVNGRILYRIGEFDLPTLGALGVELSRLPELFGLIGKFDKVAVVANQHWVRKAGEIEGALIPGVEIKAFEHDDESEAEAWLSD
jgi:hypothetical protein